MQTAITVGSVRDVMNKSGKSLAEAWLDVDAVVLLDTSGSMQTRDAREGKSRYEVACEELASLQAKMPGKIALYSFSGVCVFCSGGVPEPMFANTAMDHALSVIKPQADVPNMKIILISDGYPDSPERTLAVAKTFTNQIDTIYVGPEIMSGGADFLARLSALTHGQHTMESINYLEKQTTTLLLGKYNET